MPFCGGGVGGWGAGGVVVGASCRFAVRDDGLFFGIYAPVEWENLLLAYLPWYTLRTCDVFDAVTFTNETKFIYKWKKNSFICIHQYFIFIH